MTDEELDLLASSFLDGEATSEEVALIERDPALQARIEELRVAQAAVRGPVPSPSMQVKEAQLAAALAAFDLTDRPTTVMAVDAPGGPGEPTVQDTDPTQPVIDLRAHRARREQRQAEAAGRMRWLSAVAGVLVFAAGAVFLISQVNGGGDDGEFAGDAVTDTAATESADAQLAQADDTAAELTTSDGADDSAAIASEAMGNADAEADRAMDEAEEASEESAADAGATAEAPTEPTIREFAEGGFFDDEPVATYTQVPTSDELLDDANLPWRTTESSNCAGRAELPDGAEVIGYLPIEIPAADGGEGTTRVVEALFLTVDGGSKVVLVDAETCTVI